MKTLKTLSYLAGEEKNIEIGDELYFGQIWDGNGDGEELLQSGAVGIFSEDEEHIVEFEIIEMHCIFKDIDDTSYGYDDTLVKITDIC